VGGGLELETIGILRLENLAVPGIHQQVYNLLAGFSAFLDLPPVGKPKAATSTYRRSINILNLISNLAFQLATDHTFWAPAGTSWRKSQTGDCRFADAKTVRAKLYLNKYSCLHKFMKTQISLNRSRDQVPRTKKVVQKSQRPSSPLRAQAEHDI
jgi:hypothetical protein